MCQARDQKCRSRAAFSSPIRSYGYARPGLCTQRTRHRHRLSRSDRWGCVAGTAGAKGTRTHTQTHTRHQGRGLPTSAILCLRKASIVCILYLSAARPWFATCSHLPQLPNTNLWVELRGAQVLDSQRQTLPVSHLELSTESLRPHTRTHTRKQRVPHAHALEPAVRMHVSWLASDCRVVGLGACGVLHTYLDVDSLDLVLLGPDDLP